MGAEPKNFRTDVVVSVYPYPEDPEDVDQIIQPALRVAGGDTLMWDHQFRVAKDADGNEPGEYEEVFTEMIDRRLEPGAQLAPDPRVDALRATRDLVQRHAAAFGLPRRRS